jgi:CubicO group peptidase (beta-lactamase class C family)
MNLRTGIVMLWSLTAVCACLAGAATNSARGFKDLAEMEAFVDGVIAAQLEFLHIPGAAVAVVADGKVYFAKGYGYADLEEGRKVDPETTLFRIGSVTKLFAWTAVMQLAEQGKLDLKVDVNTYLKTFKIPATYPEPITMTHLMAHTPGSEDHVLGDFSYDQASRKPLGQVLATELPARVRPPGQLSVYSNYGAALAGHIVQEVSGMPWEDYVERNILALLDMKHTTVRQPVPAVLTKDVVTGYKCLGGEFEPQGFEIDVTSPAGAMSASATDMARFMIAHPQNGQYGGNRILSETTARTMHSPLFTNAPGVSPMLHGFLEQTLNGERTIEHKRGMVCCSTLLSLLPEQNTGLFVSYNCDTGGRGQALGGFQKAFMDHYYPSPEIQDLKPARTVPDRVAQCVGEYSSLRRSFTSLTKLVAIIDTISVRVDPEGYLVSAGAGGGPKKWVEVQPLLFREAKGQKRLAFRADAAGNITHLVRGSANAFVKLRCYETPAFHHAVAGISILLMLTALVVWPIVAFCMRGRLGSERPPRAARLLGWIMGFGLLLFFVRFLQEATDPQQFAFGVPPLLQRALWLPLAAIFLLAASAWFSVRAWTQKYWSLAGRIHYSLVTVAGLALLGWLYHWNLLGFYYR